MSDKYMLCLLRSTSGGGGIKTGSPPPFPFDRCRRNRWVEGGPFPNYIKDQSLGEAFRLHRDHLSRYVLVITKNISL